MAPILHRRAESTTLRTGIIIAAVVVSVSAIALTIYFTVGRLRYKQYLEACKKDPYLTRKEFLRRRKLSVAERIEEEEDQRRLILRKTLYSRLSSRNESEAGNDLEDQDGSRDARPKSEKPKEANHEREVKTWDAGLGREQGREVGENSPFLNGPPAMVEVERPKPHVETIIRPRRSNSLTRTPLLAEPDVDEEADREPEKAPERTSEKTHEETRNEPRRASVALWERRQNARRYASHEEMSNRRISPSPPRKALPAAPVQAASPQPRIHQTSLGQARAMEMRGVELMPPRRARAISMEPLQPRQLPQSIPSSTLSAHSLRLSSPPPTSPLPPIPTFRSHIRSHSASPAISPVLVSPPPPTARINSIAPQKNELLSPDIIQTTVPSSEQRHNRALSWDRQWRPVSNGNLHTSSSTERIRSVSPLPRRKPVPSRAVTPKASSASIISAAAAAPADQGQPSGRPLSAFSILPTPIEFIAKAPPLPRAEKVVPALEDEATIVAETTLPISSEKIPISSPKLSDRVFLPSQGPRPIQRESQLERHRSPPRRVIKRTTSPVSSESGTEDLVQFRGPGLLADLSPEPSQARPLRQIQSQQYLPVPRPNRNRSNSVNNESQASGLGQLKPGDNAATGRPGRHLRSQSFDNRLPVAQGKWELKVSLLDQTGAPLLKQSSSRSPSPNKLGEDEDLQKPRRQPTPPAMARPTELVHPARRGVPAQIEPGSSASSVFTTSPPQPQTPGTPDTDEASTLCRANFASPVKAKMLAEFPPKAPSKPPPPPLFYAPTPGSISNISPPLFYSPDFAAMAGRVRDPNTPRDERGWPTYVELEYGRDTMKETFGSPIISPLSETSELSSRLSGPPDMPAFF